jgi:hypothetical protein
MKVAVVRYRIGRAVERVRRTGRVTVSPCGRRRGPDAMALRKVPPKKAHRQPKSREKTPKEGVIVRRNFCAIPWTTLMDPPTVKKGQHRSTVVGAQDGPHWALHRPEHSLVSLRERKCATSSMATAPVTQEPVATSLGLWASADAVAPF